MVLSVNFIMMFDLIMDLIGLALYNSVDQSVDINAVRMYFYVNNMYTKATCVEIK